jgi:TfoX/Sxy family transcriptional regulator of competence genes
MTSVSQNPKKSQVALAGGYSLSHHAVMVAVYTGSVLGVRILTEQERDATRKELAWLETDLMRRRKRLVYWTLRKTKAETMPSILEDLRQSAFYFQARAEELVMSGERLRAYWSVNYRNSRNTSPPIITPPDNVSSWRPRWTRKRK